MNVFGKVCYSSAIGGNNLRLDEKQLDGLAVCALLFDFEWVPTGCGRWFIGEERLFQVRALGAFAPPGGLPSPNQK
jgi:hypothetical protein